MLCKHNIFSIKSQENACVFEHYEFKFDES